MQCSTEMITIYGDNKSKLEKTETKIKSQINLEQEKDIHLVTRWVKCSPVLHMHSVSECIKSIYFLNMLHFCRVVLIYCKMVGK